PRAAETTARDALALFRKAPADRAVITALVALSHALIAERRPDEAVPHLRETLTIAGQQAPTRLLWIKGEAQSTLGGVLASLGEPAEAETLLESGYESLRTVASTPPPRLRVAIERLVAFYVSNGKSTDAAKWRARLQQFDAEHAKAAPAHRAE